MKLCDDVIQLKGVGEKKRKCLEKIGIFSLEDVVFYFPRDYRDRGHICKIKNLRENETALIKAEIKLVVGSKYKYGRKQLLRVLVSDGTGDIELIFFNGRYLQNVFKTGDEYLFYGKVTSNFGRLQMTHPEHSRDSIESEGILPVYPLTKGITQRELRGWQREVSNLYDDVEDVLSEDLKKRNRLCDIKYALKNMHFPDDKQKLLQAKYRLVFEELLLMEIGLIMATSRAKVNAKGIRFYKKAKVKEYIDNLPYELTEAQKRCVDEINGDLESDKTMNRLVQGDVGSGKTVVAEIAMYKAVRSGYQAVLMAPTEILAFQHYEGMKKSFAMHGIKVGFLSGSMKKSEKKSLLQALKEGNIDILVGTHAVIQNDVEFKKIGLVITDEQHRFGVRQRALLREKGENVNILIMTATPIPRTLAVILYGDLDVSIIDALPPGRQPVKTRVVSEEDRCKCYDFVSKQIDKGRQAYVVTPLIEDSEAMDARSVYDVTDELQKKFPEYNVAMMHGSMKQQEKDLIMEEFYNGKIHILVATVVIEVGINVPNASVIVLENAERFGLAQMHQLRGRVGRGTHKSFCFLIEGIKSDIAMERGRIMEESTDGFYIAEEDLKLRGPGDIFGTRQHGMPELCVADLVRHIDVLKKASDEAKKILSEDENLSSPGNGPLLRGVKKLFGDEIILEM